MSPISWRDIPWEDIKYPLPHELSGVSNPGRGTLAKYFIKF
jgi:hypothetical protein